MARKILGLAHDRRPEQREGVRRVFPDRRATRCGESDRRGGPGRRRHDEESMPVRELVSTSEPHRVTGVTVFANDGSEIKPCRLRDISPDDAFLEAKNFALAEGTQLHLVLRICRDGKTTACPLPAEVIRVEEDGVALKFGHLDEHLYNILLKIVNQQGNGEVTSQS